MMTAPDRSVPLVLFFMTDRGARSLVNGSQITLGGKAGAKVEPTEAQAFVTTLP